MVKRLFEWIYAIRVCFKYKLMWIPRGRGSYDFLEKVVYVSPFIDNFISTFLHEVGHHVDNTNKNYMKWLRNYQKPYRKSNGFNIYRDLECEAFASRFALKTGRCNREFLLKAFNTYTANLFLNAPYLEGEFTKIVDCVYRNSRRIEKT